MKMQRNHANKVMVKLKQQVERLSCVAEEERSIR